jgi:hypothetical protein
MFGKTLERKYLMTHPTFLHVKTVARESASSVALGEFLL